MLKKIKYAFESSSTIDKIWITGLIIGCLVILFFIYKAPSLDRKTKVNKKEVVEKKEKEELMM